MMSSTGPVDEKLRRENFLAFNWGNLWRAKTARAKAWRKKTPTGEVTEAKPMQSEIQKELARIEVLIKKVTNMSDAEICIHGRGLGEELMEARLSCWKIIDSLRGGRLKTDDAGAYAQVFSKGVERRNSTTILIPEHEMESMEIEHKIVEIEQLLADLEERRERGVLQGEVKADDDEDEESKRQRTGSVGFTDAEKENVHSSLSFATMKLAFETVEDDKGDLVIAKPEGEDGKTMDQSEMAQQKLDPIVKEVGVSTDV